MNKKIIIGVVIGIIALTIIGGIVAAVVILNQDKVTPEEVLTQYMACIEKKDYETMYALTDGKADINTFFARNKNIYEGIEANNIKINITNVTKNDGVAQVTYTTEMNTIAGNMNFVNSAYMVREDGYYKIKWYSNLIFPDLNDTYKVRVTSLTAKRGSILDRNGVVLAEDGAASEIGLVPGKISAETKDADMKKVAQLLNITTDYINSCLSQSWVKNDTFVPLKTLNKDQTQLKEKLLEIKGVQVNESDERVYPLGEATSQLIGYIQGISAEELEEKQLEGYTSTSVIGKVGLEKVFEDRLRGIDGTEIYIANENDAKVAVLATRSVKNGENIKLTIDSELQKNIYNKFIDDKSATVVINPKTGEILAAVSTPTFDSNDFSLGMSDDKWNSLLNNANNPLYNRFLASYAPGSSFKPITGSIGLTTGAFTADDDFGKSGLKWQLDSSWNDFYVTTLSTYTGIANIRNALIYSDNIYFAKAALKIGGDQFAEKLKNMGFNDYVETPLGSVKSIYSNSDEFSSEAAIANSGYGQAEVLVNPLHMAMIYSMFVNDGNMINTYIEYKENPTPTIYKEAAIAQEAANVIKDDLIQVIENPNGTGYSARTEGLELAGKTGTAEVKQTKDDTNGKEIGWFNCFTADKASDKQFMIISMVEDVQNKGGSHYVVNRVKRVIDEM